VVDPGTNYADREIQLDQTHSGVYVVSHKGAHLNIREPISNYRNNVHSTLTITGLDPRTPLSIQFPSGVRLHREETCSDYLDIVGVEGEVNSTKRICGYVQADSSVSVITTGSKLSFTFHTDDNGTDTGFLLFLTSKIISTLYK